MADLDLASRIAHRDSYRDLGASSGTPWWEALEPRFAQQHERFDLTRADRLRIAATIPVDLALRRLGASAVGALAVPIGYRPSRVKQLLQDSDVYTRAADLGDPAAFFRRPTGPVTITRHRPPRPYFSPDGGRCWDLRFQSPFEPENPRERPDYLRHTRNRTAHARYWKHAGGPRPTLIAVHGFSADPYWLNERFFDLPRFYRMGCDVLLFTLPFHGRRRERFAPFSGHGFFAGGIARINEAFAQAMCDLRIIMDFLLEEERAPQVGVTGVSLGGFTSALFAAVEPRLAFSIPNVPVVSLADLVMEWRPLGTWLRLALAGLRKPIEDVRRLVAVTCPLTYPPAIPKERLMIIGGVGDRMAPPKHTRILWEHWGRPGLYWFPGSHLIHFERGPYHDVIRHFLRDIGFLSRL